MSDKLSFEIVEGKPLDAVPYGDFCQSVYREVYSRPDKGITPELFDFTLPSVREYFDSIFDVSDNRKAWLALNDGREIIGGVGATIINGHCEMKAFYVEPDLTGQGIGHALYQKVLEFAGSLPVQADVVHYMQDTIAMYKHWGFVVDESMGKAQYDLEGWPDMARHNYYGIYMVKL